MSLAGLSNHLAESMVEVPRQLPVIVQSSLDLARRRGQSTWVGCSAHLGLVLKQREGGTWESLVPGGAVTATLCTDQEAVAELVALLSRACDDVGARAVYFPLIYTSTRAHAWLTGLPLVTSWERSGSPSVRVKGLEEEGAAFTAAAVRRSVTSRWQTQLQSRRLDSAEAIEVLRQVERHSWKTAMGCSIFDGEEEFFKAALASGCYSAWAAWHEAEPIAYRIDAGVGDTLHAMEWSFDQRYRKLSPGKFLVLSAVHHAALEGYDQLDLYGSPDTLKCSIETHRRRRTDFLWVAGAWLPEHDALRSERLQHDNGLNFALKEGVGLARYYGHSRSGSAEGKQGDGP